MHLILAVLLVVPGIAFADPLTVTIAGLTIKGAIVAQVLMTVGMMIYGTAQQKKAEKKQRAAAQAEKDKYNAGLQDRTVNVIANELPHTYVYGRSRVGAAIFGLFASGGRDEVKHLLCVHAAHECDAIEEIYLNGIALGALDASGNVTSGPFLSRSTQSIGDEHPAVVDGVATLQHVPMAGSLTVAAYNDGYSYSPTFTLVGNVVTLTDPTITFIVATYQIVVSTPMVRVRQHLGAPDDPADPYLMAEVPGKWLPTSVLRGYCYTYIRLNLDQADFQGGLPQIEVLMRGKKLKNFRTGVTAWSQNNAEVAYDYLTSELCGVDATDLPLGDFITAANVCDEAESFGPKYTFNGTVTSDQDQNSVLDRMAESMAGGISSTTWGIYAGKYIAPVMVLEQEDIVGSVSITPGASDADIYNGVHGQYIGAETGYISSDIPPYQNAAYVEADGRELWSDIAFPYTDTAQRCHNLCRIFTEDQRNGFTVKGEFSLKTWKLKFGQRVAFRSAFFGWNEKVFRVMDKKYSPKSAVELTLKEDGPSIWDFADAVVPDSTPNTDLPNPFAIDKIASLACVSGSEQLLAQDGTIISRILATWPAATTPAVYTNGIIELEWQKVGSDVWGNMPVSGNATQAYISPVEDGALYIVRNRAVNQSLNVKSDWTYAVTHRVVGKTEPPADMLNLSINGSVLSWTTNREVDLKGYIFRFHYGNNLDWNSAAPLYEGVITEMPFDLVTRPNGVVTIMGKCLDTSSNESLATANIVTNLGDPEIANIVEVFDFHGDGFPGVIEGGSVIGGDLIANDVDSFYGSDNQSAYGLDNEPAYAESTYAQLRYVSSEVSVSSVLAGSLMTLEIDYEGTDLFIEYRLTGPGSFYGADSDSAYGLDADPAYGTGPSSWMPWPGQIAASNDVYQWRVAVGAGPLRGEIFNLAVTIDAPDLVEYLQDVLINAAGTVVPYTFDFTSIKTVTPTLQANASGAVTLEADKSNDLAPVVRAYNAAHVAVSGATADIILKGY